MGDERLLVIRGYVDATTSVIGGAPADEDGDDEAAPMEIICYRIAG